MKKKIITLTLAILALLTLLPLAATAEEASAPTATVTVNIINGTPVIAAESVTVTDTDGDGKLTVNDALYCAHEKFYTGGAEAGYASADSQYGLSLTKLWGDTSGAFGYYINHTSPLSLLDEIKEGDMVSAYIYQDQLSWTDSYSYFDRSTATVKAGESVTLTLSYLYTDYTTWETSVKLAEGAKLTVNGAETETTFDMNGQATVKLNEAGTYLISATSNMNLVAPVCVVTVETNTSLIPPTDTSSNNTKEPENNMGFVIPLCAAVICGAVAIAVVLSNKNTQKSAENDTENTEESENNEDK